jgi:hypothetical protein
MIFCVHTLLSQVRTHFPSAYTLQKAIEGDALQHREEEQRATKHDLWRVNREPCTTNKGLTTLSSEMFHGLSPLEFHGVVMKGLEPCFVVRVAHTPAFCDKVPKSQRQTRFQIDKRGKVRLFSGVG